MTQQPIVLAVETSSRIGSLAIAQGSELLDEITFSGPLRHSTEILPAAGALLERFGYIADNIAEIHISIGPGSFTGLRIAVAMAKTMHLANGVRIVAVDSLDTIAANTVDVLHHQTIQGERCDPVPDRIAAVLDAKRGRFYAAIYDRSDPGQSWRPNPDRDSDQYRIPAGAGRLWRKVVSDRLMTAQELSASTSLEKPLGLLGDGLTYHRDKFDVEGVRILADKIWSPRAANVYRLGCQKARAGLFADPLTLTPFYLRGPQVTLKKSP